MTRLWVAELSISRRTAQKIAQVHGITEDELRDAVECVRGLYGRWNDDPERGRRAVIDVAIRGRPATVVLYSAEHPMGMLGSWAACTSLTRQKGAPTMVDDDFYEDDEPIEKIQQIRRRPPDFVTGPRHDRGVTVFLAPSASGEWVGHSEPATWVKAGVCR